MRRQIMDTPLIPAADEISQGARRVSRAVLHCVVSLSVVACSSLGSPHGSIAQSDRLDPSDPGGVLAQEANPGPAMAHTIHADESVSQGESEIFVVADLIQSSPEPIEAMASGDESAEEPFVVGATALPDIPGDALLPSTVALATPEPANQVPSVERIDSNNRAVQTDLWTRIRLGFGIRNLDGRQVRNSERWYAARPDYVQRMTQRAGRYLFHIVEEVERRGMPTEIALLPFIESAFNPEALSSARASGVWQFIPSTGKDFDLRQNVFRDDRRDVLTSTRAALDYLEKLHGMFGDWHLALAAYNWGEGNVARAIAKNRRARKPTDYSHLRMPAETRHYVPKLQAVKNIVARPEAFGLALPALADHPYFVSVAIENDIDVDTAAQLSGLSVDDFRALNPQMNKPVILAAGTPQVLLPHDNADQFIQELPRYPGRLSSWTAWVAPKTMKPGDAAKQIGVSETRLRALNSIPSRMLIKVGSTLIVPRSDGHEADVSEHLADNAMIAFVPDGSKRRRVSLKAKRHASASTHGLVRQK